MISAAAPDYEIAWSGAIETEATRARQRHAEPAKPRDSSATDVVLACVEENPGATMRVIHELTGLRLGLVNGTLYSLLKQGLVSRSHRQEERPNAPVQWRIRS